MQGRWFWHSLGAATFLAALPVQAKGSKAWTAASDQATLNALTERGRYLVQAERLRAKTALEAPTPTRQLQDGETNHYVVYKVGDHWYTAFGTLSRDRSNFFVERAFAVSVDRAEVMKPIDPRSLPLDAAPFARAAKVSMDRVTSEMYARFKKLPREPIVLKVDDGYIAYVMPRENSRTAVVFGGDYKLKLTKDGDTVVGVQELHNYAYPFDLAACPPSGCIGAVHRHENDSPPTETDVAMVIRHPAFTPHFVRSAEHIFEIAKSGAVQRIAELTEQKDGKNTVAARLEAVPMGFQTTAVKPGEGVTATAATKPKPR